MTDLIKPPHAISLWATKDILYVELPSADDGSTPCHTLKLPLTVYGITQVINILRHRSPTSRLGEKGDPTQSQSDKALKEMQKLAGGYTGTITKEQKIEVTPERQSLVKAMIRRFVNV